MKSSRLEIPLTYEEAIELYHIARQIEQDFYDVSPYFEICAHHTEKRSKIVASILVSFRRCLFNAIGFNMTGREALLEKDSIAGQIPINYAWQLYRDPDEDGGYYIDNMIYYMELYNVSEYDLRPVALFGHYLLNEDMGTNIRETLCKLEIALKERTADYIFTDCGYINHNADAEPEEYEPYFRIPSDDEQRAALLQFISDYRACLDGAAVKDSRYLSVMKEYLAQMELYDINDTTYLRELPGLCVLYFGESNVSFHIGKWNMMGNAVRDIYLVKDKELAGIVKTHAEDEDVGILVWCFERICDNGQQAYSSYLNALKGWRCTEDGIALSEISCRDTDLAEDLRIGVSLFSSFMAPVILDAVSEHVKASYLCSSNEDASS